MTSARQPHKDDVIGRSRDVIARAAAACWAWRWRGRGYFQAWRRAFLEASRRVTNEASIRPPSTAPMKKYSKSSLSTSNVLDGVTCVKNKSAIPTNQNRSQHRSQLNEKKVKIKPHQRTSEPQRKTR